MFTLIRYFYKRLTVSPERNVCILGLSGAGKTSLLNQLRRLHKLPSFSPVVPTRGQNVTTIAMDGMKVTFWDVGGNDRQRPYWRRYFRQVDVVIYCCSDSCDIETAKTALEEVAAHPALAHCPIGIAATRKGHGRWPASAVMELLAPEQVLHDRHWAVIDENGTAFTHENFTTPLHSPNPRSESDSDFTRSTMYSSASASEGGRSNSGTPERSRDYMAVTPSTAYSSDTDDVDDEDGGLSISPEGRDDESNSQDDETEDVESPNPNTMLSPEVNTVMADAVLRWIRNVLRETPHRYQFRKEDRWGQTQQVWS